MIIGPAETPLETRVSDTERELQSTDEKHNGGVCRSKRVHCKTRTAKFKELNFAGMSNVET